MIRRFWILFLLPLALLAIGTSGYWLIEPDYSPFDALYMTVITLTTVGYAEVHPLSTAGRAFTILARDSTFLPDRLSGQDINTPAARPPAAHETERRWSRPPSRPPSWPRTGAT